MNKKNISKKSAFIPFVIANWKMNFLYQSTEELIVDLREKLKNFHHKCHIIVCPSLVYLDRARQLLIASKIDLGAQDAFWELSGNYTSQISVNMLKELSCRYVIIGHSERRYFTGENDEIVDRKTVTAVRNGLIPIVCVGETREQRREGVQEMVIADQVKKALRYVNPLFPHEQIIIAYEPVWSIYPGQPCQPAQAREISLIIRQALIDSYPESVVDNNFKIVYGGSVNENNVNDYADGSFFQGVLVGNASLQADKFIKIIKNLCNKNRKGDKSL